MMTHLNRTVLGVFESREEAEKALSHLESLGYDSSEISIMARDTTSQVVTEIRKDQEVGASILQGAAGGAATGGTIAGLTGLLAGIGAITIPGLGALLIGGPIAAALGLTGAAATAVAAAATGVLAGGLVGALIGLGVPRETAEVYESRIKEGGVLLAVPVHADTAAGEVQRIFQESGADEIRAVG